MDSTSSTTVRSSPTNGSFPINPPQNEDYYVKKHCSHELPEDTSVRSNLPEEFEELQGEASFENHELHYMASNFSDAECGEPMVSQHLRLDFTPVEGVDDNASIQKKCSDFWQFICNEPRLQGLMVLPGKDYEEIVSASSSESSLKKCQQVHTPAIDWLDTGIGHKMAFAAKYHSKYCSDRHGDYQLGVTKPKSSSVGRRKTVDKSAIKPDLKSDPSGIAQSRESRASRVDRRGIPSPSLGAAELCSQLEEWDQKHPKCMDPPGRVPPLTRAIMQRKVQER